MATNKLDLCKCGKIAIEWIIDGICENCGEMSEEYRVICELAEEREIWIEYAADVKDAQDLDIWINTAMEYGIPIDYDDTYGIDTSKNCIDETQKDVDDLPF